MHRLASIAAVVLGALAFAAPVLADNAGLTPVDPKSPNAEAISDTYYLLLGVTGIVFFAVEIALVIFLVSTDGATDQSTRRVRRSTETPGSSCSGRSCRCSS